MRKLLLAATALCGLAAPAYATTDNPLTYDPYDDPLHLCSSAGCSAFGAVTVANDLKFDNFGVSSSPASQTGTLYFALLIPGNETEVTLPSLTGKLNGNAFGNGSLFSNVGTFSAGQDLTNVLGSPFSGSQPPNPFSAYSAATHTADPGFNPATDHYTVFFGKVGGTNAFTAGSQAGQTITMNNAFDFSGGTFVDPLLGGAIENGIGPGAILTAFLVETSTKHGVTTTSVITTAQSSSLIFDAQPTIAPGVPEPSTWVMMGAGFGLLSLVGWRKTRSARIVV